MRKEIIYTMRSPYRDDFNIYGYRFGEGRQTLAVVGAIRGDEIEQQFTCASLISQLTEMEQNGSLLPGFEIMVIPSVNPFSMNIGKRFWSMDNTDVNRMFPGYDKGETTQRIAAALFESVKDFQYGVQLASYYIPGEFIPHVRMLNTGFQAEHEANYFGVPYTFVKDVTPYDTTLLNYNWQLWETKAFSLYTGHTVRLAQDNVNIGLEALMRFMSNIGVLSITVRPGYNSEVITDANFVTLKTKRSGFLRKYKSVKSSIKRGDLMAEVLDPFNAEVLEQIISPANGVLFFTHEKPLVLEGARAFQIIEERMI